jgi:hypothetical protein
MAFESAPRVDQQFAHPRALGVTRGQAVVFEGHVDGEVVGAEAGREAVLLVDVQLASQGGRQSCDVERRSPHRGGCARRSRRGARRRSRPRSWRTERPPSSPARCRHHRTCRPPAARGSRPQTVPHHSYGRRVAAAQVVAFEVSVALAPVEFEVVTSAQRDEVAFVVRRLPSHHRLVLHVVEGPAPRAGRPVGWGQPGGDAGVRPPRHPPAQIRQVRVVVLPRVPEVALQH